jgi:MYXO-CTERM domain-containing protein
VGTDGGAKDGSADAGDGGNKTATGDSGCGCALGNASTPFTSVLAGLAFALAARRRRRR